MRKANPAVFKRKLPDAVARACPQCSQFFMPTRKAPNQKFCGHSCAAKAHAFGESGKQIARQHAKANGDKRRGTGNGKSYIKLNGRHMHRVVAEKKLGRALAPGEIAHHADENKRNNDPSNIDVLASQAEHARLHSTGKKRPPKQICKHGHALTTDNTAITSSGARRCLMCQRAYDRAWQQSRRNKRTKHENSSL